MLADISGPDGATATRGPFEAEAALSADVTGRRLVALPLHALGPLDAEVARVYETAVGRLADTGAVIERVEAIRALDESFHPNGMLMAGEGWRIWRERIETLREEMDPYIVRRFEVGRKITDEQLDEAHRRRTTDQGAFHDWLSGFDGMVLPTCPIPAPPMDQVDESISPLSRLTRAANYLDLPAISVPCGLTAQGLPVGLQIVGNPRDEAAVVAFGAAFERVSGWDDRQPDLSGFA
jgi:aspartyl-tRNA(Asn)/glutamyl-tRNA(Gln) amidotransferase subunit A